ncbi:MAG: hypothetical protein K5694_02870 [Bacilli bacterium]|nr:hypothetical protein [Bacilli bacterium]
MNKKNILTLLSSTLALALAGCGNNNASASTSDFSSSEDVSTSISSGESSISEESASSVETRWPEAIKNAMVENLYGVVLPYVDINFDLEVNEGVVSLNSKQELYDYNDVLNYSDAFGGDYEKTVYEYGISLVKEVQTDEGRRFVGVMICAVDSEGYYIYEGEVNQGTFVINALDPYYYEFPSKGVEFIKEYAESDAVIPEYEAGYYEAGNADGMIYVYGYECEASLEEEYEQLLVDNKWTITDLVDEGGYKIAISYDEKIQLDYGYSTETESFDIFLSKYEKVYQEWPAEEVANEVARIDLSSTAVVSAYEGEGYTYTIFDNTKDFGNFSVYVYGAEEDSLTGYKTVLEKAGWSVTYDPDSWNNAYFAVSSDKTITVEFYYFYDCVIVTLYRYDGPVEYWPSGAIAAALANQDVSEELPAYNDASSYVFINDDGFTQVYAYVEEGTEEAAVDAYKKILVKAGFTLETDYRNGDNIYVSPLFQLSVQVWASEGAITIYFEKYVYVTAACLPDDLITSFLHERGCHDYDDLIPPFEGYRFTYRSDYKESFMCYFFIEGGSVSEILKNLSAKGFETPSESGGLATYECYFYVDSTKEKYIEVDVGDSAVEGIIEVNVYCLGFEE